MPKKRLQFTVTLSVPADATMDLCKDELRERFAADPHRAVCICTDSGYRWVEAGDFKIRGVR